MDQMRSGYDATVGQTLLANGVNYEPAVVGGIPGMWCRPKKHSAKGGPFDAAIL
jgi:hypothetical protein